MCDAPRAGGTGGQRPRARGARRETAALGIILLSPTMYEQYGLDYALAPVQLKNPGIVFIPLSFASIVLVSLFTGKRRKDTGVVYGEGKEAAEGDA